MIDHQFVLTEKTAVDLGGVRKHDGLSLFIQVFSHLEQSSDALFDEVKRVRKGGKITMRYVRAVYKYERVRG